MHLHILGICGTLMGSIALLARDLGHRVTGSDKNVYPPMSTQLSDAGITLHEGFDERAFDDRPDLVIIGNAGLPRGNPAVEYVLAERLPYTSGAGWLGRYLLADRHVLAVAGTHGKTTTASMLTHILTTAGMDPGYLIGGVPLNSGRSAALGGGRLFVIEADEYDTSYFDRRSKFLHYKPQTLVLNNLEFDHADIFPDLAAIKDQFALLLRTVPENGLILHAAGDENLDAVIDIGCWTPRQSFNLATGDWRASTSTRDAGQFSVRFHEQSGDINWALSGEHNIRNALAAVAAAHHVGVNVADACAALSSFEGVKRRMEVIFRHGSTVVYDDFAHHPTAIETTLRGLRQKIGDNAEIIAVIEPASHTMRKGTHATSLRSATEAADHTVWFKPAPIDWDIERAVDAENATVLGVVGDILRHLEQRYRPGTNQHFVVMSNGGFGGFRERLVTLFRENTAKPV
jgi:UDP-N-acetylmuramate: L-alanyl-gamma-D-glutamyl-meso-diaminopimelate ligase